MTNQELLGRSCKLWGDVGKGCMIASAKAESMAETFGVPFRLVLEVGMAQGAISMLLYLPELTVALASMRNLDPDDEEWQQAVDDIAAVVSFARERFSR